MNINMPSNGHVGPAATTGADGTPRRWDPYPSPFVELGILTAAIGLILNRTISVASVFGTCNDAFKKLPLGKTWAEIWVSPTFWISFNPNPKAGLFGTTMPGTQEITIAKFPFTQADAAAVVAATIIHEMAHVNGVRGGASPLAEEQLTPCGFDDQRIPGLLGQLWRADSMSRLA
jgi:hypothetical protein